VEDDKPTMSQIHV